MCQYLYLIYGLLSRKDHLAGIYLHHRSFHKDLKHVYKGRRRRRVKKKHNSKLANKAAGLNSYIYSLALSFVHFKD